MRDIPNKVDNTDVLSAAEFNGSIMQELENAVTPTGISLDPAGGPDTDTQMLAQAITRTAQGALSYQDSGAADAYVLSAIGGFTQPSAYTDGMVVLFEVGNTNTGASTINVAGIGVSDLVDAAGVALTAGAIVSGNIYIAKYDLAGTEFRIQFSSTQQSSDTFGTQLLHVQDQKTSGTEGGAASSGVNTRVLNTSVTNEISGSSLGSNQITLPAGDYFIEASAPTHAVDEHKVYLYNVTDAADVLIGTSEFANGGPFASTRSFVNGRFTLAGTKALEIRHYVNTTKATNGFGKNTGTGQIEVYTDVKIWKVG